jgi:Zn-finger protein
MKENNAKYFSNTSCTYYPCHKAADPENFNCLFCYCPLYALGEKCGGHFRYTDKGVKDCTNCTLPHDEGGYEHVMAHVGAVLEMAKK